MKKILLTFMLALMCSAFGQEKRKVVLKPPGSYNLEAPDFIGEETFKNGAYSVTAKTGTVYPTNYKYPQINSTLSMNGFIKDDYRDSTWTIIFDVYGMYNNKMIKNTNTLKINYNKGVPHGKWEHSHKGNFNLNALKFIEVEEKNIYNFENGTLVDSIHYYKKNIDIDQTSYYYGFLDKNGFIHGELTDINIDNKKDSLNYNIKTTFQHGIETKVIYDFIKINKKGSESYNISNSLLESIKKKESNINLYYSSVVEEQPRPYIGKYQVINRGGLYTYLMYKARESDYSGFIYLLRMLEYEGFSFKNDKIEKVNGFLRIYELEENKDKAFYENQEKEIAQMNQDAKKIDDIIKNGDDLLLNNKLEEAKNEYKKAEKLLVAYENKGFNSTENLYCKNIASSYGYSSKYDVNKGRDKNLYDLFMYCISKKYEEINLKQNQLTNGNFELIKKQNENIKLYSNKVKDLYIRKSTSGNPAVDKAKADREKQFPEPAGPVTTDMFTKKKKLIDAYNIALTYLLKNSNNLTDSYNKNKDVNTLMKLIDENSKTIKLQEKVISSVDLDTKELEKLLKDQTDAEAIIKIFGI